MVTCYWKIHESFLDTNSDSDTPSEATQHEKNERKIKVYTKIKDKFRKFEKD